MYSSTNMQAKLGSFVNKFFRRDIKGSLAVTGSVKTRRGYVAMYVGKEGKRYEVPVKYLSNPVFQELLRRSQHQDLEYKIEGAIRIPHSTAFFDQFLRIMKEENQRSLRMEIKVEETLKLSYDDFEPFCKWKREEGHDILEVHLKDFQKQQLRVQIKEPGVVTITGERPLYDTRRSRFNKQIRIPKNCKINEIRATFSGGILHVVVPEKTPAFPAELSRTENITTSTSMPSNYLLGMKSSSWRLELNTKLALKVAGMLALVVAFGAHAYKYCHCDHDTNTLLVNRIEEMMDPRKD
ncbi:unnamed protein product [Dovyalis caffra]|uniref:SHSP domain-containing protein n=1 Tax=Dovyalis caffra TaxID=77055 RepID=A0AAV1RY06_9ROSI|nr:unnamed protein product [Dovyalis caffra]